MVKSSEQAQIDAESVSQAIKTLTGNLKNLSFQNKGLCLEALNIRVTLDMDSVTVEGALPIPSTSASLNKGRGAGG